MTTFDFPFALLRLRLFLTRQGAGAGLAIFLCLAGAGGWAWVARERAALARLEAAPVVAAAAPLAPGAPLPSAARQNLALFYARLGPRRYAEEQVKTLFALAAQSKLTLNQGEYKFGYDPISRVSTYQVVLPLKGAYQSIWQFGMRVLLTVPFAALDEISFKRELIADPALEARMRLTFYLKDEGEAP
ncbi:MAG TPA: hypothetical protein DCW29_24105 [Janthinobacterium sp.]|nr:hypothetical protein [Janthinobacterium sp.]